MTNIEPVLSDHEEHVDLLIKSATRYISALKTWKKACQTGHLANRQKAATQSVDLAQTLAAPTEETAGTWQFNAAEYLQSGAWRAEIADVAESRFGIRTFEETDTLVSSPVVVRALPAKAALAIGKVNWQNLHPRQVAAELRKLRDRAGASNSQEFADSLFGASSLVARQGDAITRFRDLYDLFALTPGWKKDNPPAAFAQAIYALHKSELKSTRSGRAFDIESPSGQFKDKDIFSVIAEDGQPMRYLGIRFHAGPSK